MRGAVRSVTWHTTRSILGLGRIGMAVVKMASGLNMKILGYDPLAAPKDAEKSGVEVTDDPERAVACAIDMQNAMIAF